MDWMYDGIKVEKEDYLLGRKVDKNLGDNSETFLPTPICLAEDKFSQVDMSKKISEDPLVKIKKREIECTQKLLQNPMRLKKQQNTKLLQKNGIDDHQLDMILVSRLKSYEKAGLDLAQILSITKHKKKHKEDSKETEKELADKTNNDRQRKQRNKSASLDREVPGHSPYKDQRQEVNRKYNQRRRYDSPSQRRNYDRNLRKRSVSSESNGSPSDRNKRNEHKEIKYNRRPRSRSPDDKFYQKNKNSRDRNNDGHEPRNYVRKYNDDDSKDNKSRYKERNSYHQSGKNNDRKRHRSPSCEKKSEQTNPKRYEAVKNKNQVKDRLGSSDEEIQKRNSKNSNYDCKSSNNRKDRNRKSRSSSSKPHDKQKKKTEPKKHYDNDKHESKLSSDSDYDKSIKVSKLKPKRRHSSSESSLSDAEHNKNETKPKNYGLFVPDAQKLKKKPSNNSLVPSKVANSQKAELVRLSESLKKKGKMTDEEMEKLRKEMMHDAKIRDKERSSNVKRYRKVDAKEEEKQKPYSKEFLIKQLAHAASQVSVERSIKSNINKLQKNPSMAD
ncbi:pre-mRNA-splicing factor CWC25 homolog isoform X2 [Adelges cooleyi]|uniref:pre-mRNA-splicing factor CWC25 homolog isoform X2 n=1 Tax=Adelges cooleyi TaxID=133065 RepID=UPI00217F5696|nr:pre-mRNA-splicing factor CWC25 homolog isoform X2 [Adelges cooleyi]